MRSFASDYNISETMVYKHLKNLRDNPEFQNHIYKKSGITYFDDKVIHEIEQHLTKTAVAISDAKIQTELDAAREKIADLQAAYTDALLKLTDTQNALLESKNTVILLSNVENQKKILENNLEIEKHRSQTLQDQQEVLEHNLDIEKQQIQRLQDKLSETQEQLSRELQRPLTVRERITGRRKQNIDDREKSD